MPRVKSTRTTKRRVRFSKSGGRKKAYTGRRRKNKPFHGRRQRKAIAKIPVAAPSSTDTKEPNTNTTDTKPLLVMLHADWCHICKGVLPAWKEALAEKANVRMIESEEANYEQKLSDIRTQYSLDSKAMTNIQGFPSIYKITDKQCKEVVDGGRTKESILKLLAEN